MFTGWAGWGARSTVQNKMIGSVCRELRHPGASPKITETLEKTERGSGEDEPAVPRAGRASFLSLDQGCGATSGTGSASERGEKKATFERVKTLLQGQKTRTRLELFKGGPVSDPSGWMRDRQQRQTNRPDVQ